MNDEDRRFWRSRLYALNKKILEQSHNLTSRQSRILRDARNGVAGILKEGQVGTL